MPYKHAVRKRERRDSHPGSPEPEQQAGAPAAKQPAWEPVEEVPVEQERPHQAFVEDEAREYWQDMLSIGALAKPAQAEIRDAAMPVLCAARRRRLRSFPLDTGHRAAAAVADHVMSKDKHKRPKFDPYQCQTAADVMIQLADYMGIAAGTVTLPDHPPPYHPPVYYTLDPETGRPIPREDSLIRGDYVYECGFRISRADYIRPLPVEELQPDMDWAALCRSVLATIFRLGWDACYTLYEHEDGSVHPRFFWIYPGTQVSDRAELQTENDLLSTFTPPPPPGERVPWPSPAQGSMLWKLTSGR